MKTEIALLLTSVAFLIMTFAFITLFRLNRQLISTLYEASESSEQKRAEDWLAAALVFFSGFLAAIICTGIMAMVR